MLSCTSLVTAIFCEYQNAGVVDESIGNPSEKRYLELNQSLKNSETYVPPVSNAIADIGLFILSSIICMSLLHHFPLYSLSFIFLHFSLPLQPLSLLLFPPTISHPLSHQVSDLQAQWKGIHHSSSSLTSWDTGLPPDLLKYIAARSVAIPENFVS